MKKYLIQHTDTLPDWSQIPTLTVSNVLWLPDAGIRMSQQVCYSRTTLYIHQQTVEEAIRAEHIHPLAQVCEDSCMEFFFCPDPDSDRYFNFEFNPNGCLYLGWCSGNGLNVRLHPKQYMELFDVHTFRTKDG